VSDSRNATERLCCDGFCMWNWGCRCHGVGLKWTADRAIMGPGTRLVEPYNMAGIKLLAGLRFNYHICSRCGPQCGEGEIGDGTS
jgi:hypothetical protein